MPGKYLIICLSTGNMKEADVLTIMALGGECKSWKLTYVKNAIQMA